MGFAAASTLDPSYKGSAVALGPAAAPGSAAPTKVQNAFTRRTSTTSGTITVTLPAPPTAGNLVIAIATGFGTTSTPSGWNLERSDAASSVTNQYGFIFSRVVQSGDPAAWSFSVNNGPITIYLIEINNAVAVNAFSGAGTASTTTLTSTVSDSAEGYTLLVHEHDSTSTYTSTGGTATASLLMNGDSTGGGNHPSVLYEITASGTVITTFSATVNSPFYIGLNVYSSVYANSTATVSSGTGSVRGTNKISGLVYGEWTIGATLTGSARVGVCNNAFTLTGLLGVDLNGVGYDSGGTVKINNVTVATIASYAAGNNVSMAIDPLRRLAWFRVNGGNWNNDVIGNQNPVGAVGGIDVSSVGGGYYPAWGGSATSSVTSLFASALWAYSAPTGYSTMDTLQASGDNGAVASHSATFTQYGRSNGSGTFAPGRSQSILPPLPDGSGTVSGQVKEAGVAVSGKTVLVYEQKTGVLLGMTISDGSGNWSIKTLGKPQVFAVALDPTYQAIVYDQLTPV